MRAIGMAAALCAACLAAPGVQAQSGAAPAMDRADDTVLRWLDPARFAPDAMFAAPPARGSLVEKTDLDRIRALIAASSPERLAQAKWDGAHEDPSAFSAAAGRDLTKLPATMDLLTTIQDEVERVVTAAKIHFARPRPNQVDPALPSCGKPKAELRGYPSGHAAFGWAAAWTLARLLPDRAIPLLARAQDYALSRELCGTHFSFDVEASHPLGVLAADQMLADPRLAPKVAAARAELGR